jgi:outer membrane protein assembly factor BamB
MRLLLALTATLPLAAAVFRDEAYQIDYHHALLGIPEAQNTFFHPPNPSSKASLIYTLSEKSLIGAINPKDGAVVWRQRLESAVNSSRALLKPEEGGDIVASATDGEVAAWAAKDGRLIWREEFEEVGGVVGLGFLEKDVLVLFQGAHPVVQRRDGATGAVVWQFGDMRYVTVL